LPDGPAAEQILEDPGNLFVRDLRVARIDATARRGEQALALQQAAGAHQPRAQQRAAPKKRSTGGHGVTSITPEANSSERGQAAWPLRPLGWFGGGRGPRRGRATCVTLGR